MKSPNFYGYNFGLPKIIVKRFSLLFFILFSFSLFSQQLAFPSATGAGAYVTGGRGKPVYIVSNLNDSGSGSFRQCLQDAKNSNGGIITFAVSGTIVLNSMIYMSGLENVTIAGQTAPNGGITIARYTLYWVDVDNLIMRYIRVRPDLGPHVNEINEIDTFYINGDNYIIDHCSFSWGSDEVASSGVGSTYTWQRNLFAEGTKVGSIMGYSQDYPNSGNMSIVNNMWYNISHRFPNINSDNRVDVINNVAWNYTYRLSSIERNGEFNYIGNYFLHKTDNLTLSSLDDYGCFLESGSPSIYTAKNYLNNVFEDPQDDNWPLWRYWGGGELPESMKADNPFTLLGKPFEIKYAVDALNDVKYNVGCNARLDEDGNILENIDGPDNVYLTNVQNNVKVPYVLLENLETEHHDTFQASVSTTPISSGYQDSNSDGIPDAWVISKGFGINDDLTTYEWPSGYVGIEEFLNEIDSANNGSGEIIAEDLIVSPETATINIPETIQLTTQFIPENTSNQTGNWSSSNTSIATVNQSGLVTPISEGEVEITFTSNDGGLSDSSTITVTNEVIPVTSVSITPNEITIDLNESTQLTSEFLPINANNTDGIWTSSNNDVAIVNDQGLVTGISEGTATINFVLNDNPLISDTSEVSVVDSFYGSYEFYNAESDTMIQEITTDEVFNLDEIGDQVNFRTIPEGGDNNANVESILVEWTGAEEGSWIESDPIYSGLPNGHVGLNFESYTVMEGVYNFTVTYYSENNATGNIVSTDNFSLTFIRGFQVNAGEDQSICQGDQIELTASGADTYLWNNGETTTSIIVSPTETTTYTVTGTDSEGNESTDSVTVTVNPLPIANAGEDVEICENETVSLSASGGESYLWSTGETSSAIEVSPSETATYTVTVTTNGCSTTDEVIVTVRPRPSINAGNDVDLNLGDSITLTASGDGAFVWSTGEETESITVSPTETTTYSVTASLNGCSNTDSVIVNVISQNTVEANAGEDVTICQTNSVILTASGGDSYLWSTGETTQSIEVNPMETTIYTVTAYSQNGSDTDEVIVNVNETPTAYAGEDETILFGESVVLTASGGSEYLWNTGETTQSIVVSPEEDKIFIVEVFENSCSSTDSVEVVVNANANAGEDVYICQGESTTLTASGGTDFVWSTGETTSSISVSPTQTTTYTVMAISGDSTDEAEVTVNVNLIPNADAGEDDIIESGQNITLSATGGNSYLWSTGETSQHISVSPTQTTLYSVEVFINGCSDFDDVLITVVDPVNADAGEDIDSCPGETVTLTATGGLFYVWSTGQTSPSINVIPEETTTYSVTVSNGISSQTDDVRVSVENCLASSEELQNNEFEYRMYPNPTNGLVNIRLSGLENISSIYITDMLGKQLIGESFQPENGFVINKQYNLSGLSKGIYFITLLESGKEAITKKLILQ